MNHLKTPQLSFHGHPVNVRLRTSDVSVFQGIFLEGAYDLSFLNLNPKTIIDGGANVGFSSIFFAHAYPQARVFAVEPEESNFRMLLENTKFYPNIVPIRAALWHREGKLRIENPKADKWSFTVTESTENEDSGAVDALTLDRLLAMSETELIDILKLDIEGAETELFCANYENWIEKTSVIIIELHDRIRKGCSDAFYNATARHNFQKKERQEHVILFRTPKFDSAVSKEKGVPDGGFKLNLNLSGFLLFRSQGPYRCTSAPHLGISHGFQFVSKLLPVFWLFAFLQDNASFLPRNHKLVQ